MCCGVIDPSTTDIEGKWTFFQKLPATPYQKGKWFALVVKHCLLNSACGKEKPEVLHFCTALESFYVT